MKVHTFDGEKFAMELVLESPAVLPKRRASDKSPFHWDIGPVMVPWWRVADLIKGAARLAKTPVSAAEVTQAMELLVPGRNLRAAPKDRVRLLMRAGLLNNGGTRVSTSKLVALFEAHCRRVKSPKSAETPTTQVRALRAQADAVAEEAVEAPKPEEAVEASKPEEPARRSTFKRRRHTAALHRHGVLPLPPFPVYVDGAGVLRTRRVVTVPADMRTTTDAVPEGDQPFYLRLQDVANIPLVALWSRIAYVARQNGVRDPVGYSVAALRLFVKHFGEQRHDVRTGLVSLQGWTPKQHRMVTTLAQAGLWRISYVGCMPEGDLGLYRIFKQWNMAEIIAANAARERRFDRRFVAAERAAHGCARVRRWRAELLELPRKSAFKSEALDWLALSEFEFTTGALLADVIDVLRAAGDSPMTAQAVAAEFAQVSPDGGATYRRDVQAVQRALSCLKLLGHATAADFRVGRSRAFRLSPAGISYYFVE